VRFVWPNESSAMLSRLPRHAVARCPKQSRAFGFSDPAPTTESFASGASAKYIERMYAQWKAQPGSVHASWAAYFKDVDAGVGLGGGAYVAPPSVHSHANLGQAMASSGSGATSDAFAVSSLIRAYQERGHEGANLDPLNLHQWRTIGGQHGTVPELDYTSHGFSEADLDRTLNLAGWPAKEYAGFRGAFSSGDSEPITLRQLIAQLKTHYCGSLGIEFMHMQDHSVRRWIQGHVEMPDFTTMPKDKQLHVFERLCFAQYFENFLGQKFATTKRFGLDGGEAVIPGLMELVDTASAQGCKAFCIGMAHRGRLNILANVLRKPLGQIFAEFLGSHYSMDDFYRSQEDQDWFGAGDVKYHLGQSMDRQYEDGRRIHMSLAPNPSHLECVAPVVLGKTRAKQFYAGDTEKTKEQVMCVVIHGDAAMAGQGIVYESFQLCGVDDFSVGGTVHVIINNQVGFTTDPRNSRSTAYCSDIGKAFGIPIFHCNGDDPIAVVKAFKLAADWRMKYKKDAIIDLICYRRKGHNEIDNPMFTQPLLYKTIDKHPALVDTMEKQLLANGISAEDTKRIKDHVMRSYEEAYDQAESWTKEGNRAADLPERPTGQHSLSVPVPSNASDFSSSGRTQNLRSPSGVTSSDIHPTGVQLDVLRRIGEKIAAAPADFKMHRTIARGLQAKKLAIEEGSGIDWGTGEALAIGTLLLEGNHVRLTGQDVQRGTFSHRNCVVHDQDTDAEYTFLNTLAEVVSTDPPRLETTQTEVQAKFVARNSILSEYGILGFEYGYSLENPRSLVIWEAQFGDFANTAQVMFDQFIASCESKWHMQTGLVMLLPHGFEGQGAEHSSCRLERFLQMCDDDEDDTFDRDHDGEMDVEELSRQMAFCNWQVCNITTPANYFHALRRQIQRDFRKPLVVAAPKYLLRLKAASSNLEDFGPETQFQRLIPERDADIANNPDQVKRLVFCSGKVYYHLLEEREKAGRKDVAICTVEQLSPFPYDLVAEQMQKYSNVNLGDGVYPGDVVWCQEEPKNMGPWPYVKSRLVTAARDLCKKDVVFTYAGRKAAASPATGLPGVHFAEQNALVEKALA